MASSFENCLRWVEGVPNSVLVSGAAGLAFVGYVIYYRYLHPLAKYQGPALASVTNLWKTYHLWNLHLPQDLVRLHEQYGPVVRVGPNDLSFQSPDAVGPIYKGGRNLKKTAFYDGFTTFNPNLFGTQDDEIHAVRRRQMAHTFSMQNIKDMEHLVDSHVSRLRKNLDHVSGSGEIFDLKLLISFYVLDVLGELAFSRSFEAQAVQDPTQLPPINDHIFLACLMGMTPEVLPFIKRALPYIPLPWLKRLLSARMKLKNLTAECVHRRINDKSNKRKDLLSCLIQTTDPETGAKLTELDINTEAFALVVAGSHTTSGTLTLLFSHLLQNPSILNKVVQEIRSQLSHLTDKVLPFDELEKNLPYTMACVAENFRINPVFSMPLPRKVKTPGGIQIHGHLVPQNTTVFSLNHVTHHDASVWGLDHAQFRPDRFLGPNGKELKNCITPFSVGHRMCIGKNMAMMNLLKVLTTVLKNYELEMVHPEQPIEAISVGISEKDGRLLCRVSKR